jgi:hypothetical protein
VTAAQAGIDATHRAVRQLLLLLARNVARNSAEAALRIKRQQKPQTGRICQPHVAGKVDVCTALERVHRPAGPERRVAVKETAPGKVLRGRARHEQLARRRRRLRRRRGEREASAAPPIKLGDVVCGHAEAAHEGREPERHGEVLMRRRRQSRSGAPAHA